MSTPWPLRAFVVLASCAVAACSGSRVAADPQLGGEDCRDSARCLVYIERRASENPAEARRAYEQLAGRMTSDCDRLFTPSSTVWEPNTADGASACVQLAALRTGIPTPDVRHPARVRALSEQAVPADMNRGLDDLTRLCTPDVPLALRFPPGVSERNPYAARAACDMLGHLHSAGFASWDQSPVAVRFYRRACQWIAVRDHEEVTIAACMAPPQPDAEEARAAVTLDLREAAARATLDRLRREPNGDTSTGRALTARLAALLDGVQDPAFVALRSAGQGEVNRVAEPSAEALLDPLERIETLEQGADGELSARFAAAFAAIGRAPERARAALNARWSRAVDHAMFIAARRREYDAALALLDSLREILAPAQLQSQRAAIVALRTQVEQQLAALESLPEAPRPDPGLPGRYMDVLRALALEPPARRAELEARWLRALDVAVERLAARRWYGPAEAMLQVATIVDGVPERLTRLRAEAARFHAGLSASQRAARRPAAARFHAERAQHFGARTNPTAFAAAIAALRPPTALRVTWDSSTCALAGAPPAAPSARAALRVAVRWTRCESAETRRNTTDTYTYATQETVRQPVQEWGQTSRGSPGQCTAPPEYTITPLGGRVRNYAGPTCVGVTEPTYGTVTVMRDVVTTVQHAATRQTQRRRLTAELEAELTVMLGGQTLRVPITVAESPFEEEQYDTPHGQQVFSSVTLGELQGRLRARLADALIPAGSFWTRIVGAEAARLDAEGTAQREGAPLVAEDAYARLVILPQLPAAARESAEAYFMERYGVTTTELREGLGILDAP